MPAIQALQCFRQTALMPSRASPLPQFLCQVAQPGQTLDSAPPSTSRILPVTQREAGPARYAAAGAMASTSPSRGSGVALSVLKNTLVRRAVAGSSFESVADQMTGPLIYGFSEDAVSAAKVVADFAKTNDKLVIRGGVYGGKALDADGVKQLASIPTKEVLLAQLCGLLMSPMSRTAVVLGALAAKRGGGEAVAA